MGKVKKPAVPSKDEGQKKISSFFQMSAEKASNSATLFSEVGRKTHSDKSSVSMKGSKSGSSIAKENKSPSNIVTIISDSGDADEFLPSKKIRSPNNQFESSENIASCSRSSGAKVEKANKKVQLGHRKNKSPNSDNIPNDLPVLKNRPVQADSQVVPETQFMFTPEIKQSKNERQVKAIASESFSSPILKGCDGSDFGLIPDTPESNEINVKPKRPLGRSFLLSSTSIASNPIQKAKENRLAKLALKKKATLARKSLLSVSVTFNDNKSIAGGTESDIAKESSLAMNTSLCSIEDKFGSHSQEIVDKVADTTEMQEVTAADNKTPTKIYINADTSSLKRMAKSGLSPDGKRTNGENTGTDIDMLSCDDAVKALDFENKTRSAGDPLGKMCVDSADVDLSNTDVENTEPFGEVIEFEKLRQEKERQKKERLEKKRLELLEERRRRDRQLKKENHEKLLNYQLSGNVNSGKRISSGQSIGACKETVQNDDTLDDLLQELKSPSLLKSESKTKCTKAISKPSYKPQDSDTHILNKHNQMTFSDYSIDTKVNSAKLTLVKPKCTTKRLPENPESSSGFMAAEWTDEDETYFKKLGMSVETNTVNKPEKLCDEKITRNHCSELVVGTCSSVCNNKDKDCDLETNAVSVHTDSLHGKIKPILQTKVSTSNESNRNFSSEVKPTDCYDDIKEYQTQADSKSNIDKNDLNEENDILMFPTPCIQVPEIEKFESKDELDIDEFGSQLDSELLCDEFEHLTPFKSSKKSDGTIDIFQTEAPCTEFGRHVITAVDHDSERHETTLTVVSCPGDVTRSCILHGFWLDTHLQVGGIVNILASFKDNVCHITDTEGLLVVNPDILLSGTTVVSSVFCMRKSILKEKFKGCDTGNIQMLYGSIIHSVFQQVLRKKLVTEEAILKEAERIVKQTSSLLEMYGNKVTDDAVMNEIKTYLPQIIAWTKQHTNIGQDLFGNQRKTKPDILVTKVSDIEENIWSPRFGIKGKIDLTVETHLKEEKSKKILPLELKTGKPSYSVEHKGQVTLYSMMCSDRREDPGRGLLLYLKEPSMKVIPADHVNQKGLIQLRNEMAYYISRQVVKTLDEEGQTTFNLGRLPEPITNLRACQKCPQLTNCAIYQREVEGRQSVREEISGLVNETLQHLTSSHMTYFTHWCLMLDLESQKDQAKRTVADIWCRSSTDREAVGECISGVVLSDTDDMNNENEDSAVLTFQRHKDNNRSTPLLDIGINVQDSVVISSERPSWIAMCTGFVHQISSTEIQVLIDREGVDRLSGLKTKALRIDKCDSFSTAGMFYTNVSRLMQDELHCQKLRNLIIDRVKPEFLNTLSKGNIEKVKSIFKKLNKPQKTSILKVLMSKDYVLIKGYPGTGKTSTIVALVKVLSGLGYSVLLTSYTHSAVDNILLKLKKDHVKFLRIGRISKIHPDIREFSVEKLTQGFKTTVQLEEFLHSQNIVATSCLGTNHPLFTRRQFDVCIVDEASQVIQPACLGPLFCCKKFVLVGDPKQLPPVVQSKEARNLGMDESLFVRLESTGATYDLNLQYRMNSDIMYLSNQLVYDGCLKCGSDYISNRVIHLPNREKIAQVIDKHPWLGDVVNDDLCKSVVFLNTEKVPAREEKCQAGTLHNPTESKIVLKIVETLVMGGIDPDEIGIIAPYRSQVFLIRSRLSEGEGHWRSKVEVNTVDQYQGRDKSVIMISFVRSSEDQENLTGELLKDIRRLNVALTRAKVKLILIGNKSTLVHYPPLRQLIELLQDRNQILQLPKGLVSKQDL